MSAFLITGMNSDQWLPSVEELLVCNNIPYTQVNDTNLSHGILMYPGDSSALVKDTDMDLSIEHLLANGQCELMFLFIAPEFYINEYDKTGATSNPLRNWLHIANKMLSFAIKHNDAVKLIPYTETLDVIKIVKDQPAFNQAKNDNVREPSESAQLSITVKQLSQAVSNLDLLADNQACQIAFERLMGLAVIESTQVTPIPLKDRRQSILDHLCLLVEENNKQLLDIKAVHSQDIQKFTEQKTQLDGQLKNYESEIEISKLQVHQLQEELEQVYNQYRDVKEKNQQLLNIEAAQSQDIHKLTEQKAQLDGQLKNYESEIEISQLQVHQLQEELEQVSKQCRDFKEKNQQLLDSKALQSQDMHELTEQKTRLEEQLKNKESEIELAVLQINQLQEELEYLYINHKESLNFEVDKIYSLNPSDPKFKLSLDLLRYT